MKTNQTADLLISPQKKLDLLINNQTADLLISPQKKLDLLINTSKKTKEK